MKIGYISDIHINSWLYRNRYSLSSFIKNFNNKDNIDVLIIAGDITESLLTMEFFFDEIQNYYENILFTLGNHDYYIISEDIKNGIETSLQKYNKIKEIITKYNNIHFLDGDIISINNIKIAGLSNWYNVNENNIKLWEKNMMDKKYIKIPYSIIDFKKDRIKKLNKLSDKSIDIIFSHIMLDKYPTIEEGLPLKYLNNNINNFFYSNKNLIKKYHIKTKYHIFGHTHNNYNFKRDNINYLCNPLGYIIENNYKLKDNPIRIIDL